jgi:nitroimidazol reductase NimA-like FMN-containing flavoprotein (pyridoxamine 5'-phosphate oxidase superfamily)
MHETADDLRGLQDLLDRSYESAGAHLREITTPERTLDANNLSNRLTGMCLLVLATVTHDCRPLVGAVDGIFHRGAFYFGSSPESVRFQHIRKRPQVSATHLPSEAMAVTVHGRAVPIDIGAAEQAEFRATLLDVYVPLYGADWEQWVDSGPVYARIDAQKMFTYQMK